MTSERAREVAEQIAGDSSCAQGEFHQRVNAILPYLAKIERQREALEAVDSEIALEGQLKELVDSALA